MKSLPESSMLLADYLDGLERNACLRINRLSRYRGPRYFFEAVSRLGDYPAWIVLGLLTAFHPGTDTIQVLLQAILVGLVGVVAYRQLKQRLIRERPFVRYGDIVCGAAPLDRYSFPSGHTLHAVSFTILFGSQVPELLWILIPFTACVAASRVILGLHYPSDVLAGATLGALLATSSLALTRWLIHGTSLAGVPMS